MENSKEQFEVARRQEDPQLGKSLAMPLLEIAVATGDLSLQGQLMSHVAECENLLSQHRAAFDRSTQALTLLREVGDTAAEVKALAVQSFAASALGRNEQAVEAAMLAFQLTQQTPDLALQCEAQLQLGAALLHARCFDAAVAALHAARSLAAQDRHLLNELVSITTEGACEMTRIICERHELGRPQSLARLNAVCQLHESFAAAHDMDALAEPDQRPLQIGWRVIASIAHSWRGEFDLARLRLNEAGAWLLSNPVAPWLESQYTLAHAEYALAMGDWPAAEAAAAQMVEIGNRTCREQSALLGHLVAFHVLDAQGKSAAALHQFRLLAARERRIRTENISSRGAVVGWQLHGRKAEQNHRELQVSAQHLQRLSLEDPLTGIANRRCFEDQANFALQERAAACELPSIVLIDVDRFKTINDTHGHLTGDAVLKALASLLKGRVRDGDLAARLAGDEFVLLLPRTSVLEAADVCDRITAAVKAVDWSAIAPDLQVSVSLGASQAAVGESLAQVLHRSDLAMYERKNLDRRQAGVALA